MALLAPPQTEAPKVWWSRNGVPLRRHGFIQVMDGALAEPLGGGATLVT